MQPKPHHPQDSQQPQLLSQNPRKSSSLHYSRSASSSTVSVNSRDNRTASSSSQQQLPPDFNFAGYRETLSKTAQTDENISPSSSQNSLVSYFRRTNSAGGNSQNSHSHSVQHKPSVQSITSTTSGKSHKHSLIHPGLALNRLKNSVVQHHRKHHPRKNQPEEINPSQKAAA